MTVWSWVNVAHASDATASALDWAAVVLTSYFRRLYAHHSWKVLHYTAYAAALVFYVHGTLADPLLQGRPPDFIDAEKAYVEGCGLLVVAATAWRYKARRGPRGRAATLVVRPS